MYRVRDKRLAIRMSVGELDGWKQAAAAAGLALSDWVRIVLEGATHTDEETHTDEDVRTPVRTPRASRERRMMCEHRILPGAYCRQCDRP